MSDVFHKYHEEYCDLSQNLSKECSSAISLKGEQKTQKLSEITSDLKKAKELIDRMDIAADLIQLSIRSIFLVKLRESKSNLKILKSQIRKVKSGNLNVDESCNAEMAESRAVSADQRSRLMKSTESLVRTTGIIADSGSKMLEIENNGVLMLQKLRSQRETIQCSQETVLLIENNLEETDNTSWIYWALAGTGVIIISILFKLVKN